MRLVPFVPALALALLFGAELTAQGGGRGRGRPEEITNRTGAFFTTVAGQPPTATRSPTLPPSS
jgi:hypothetical protein